MDSVGIDEATRMYDSGEIQNQYQQQQIQASYQTPEEFVSDIFDATEEQRQIDLDYIQEFIVDNPFAFDELLAEESATAQYEPYYSELLEDYLSGVNLQRETIQDERKFLTELNVLKGGESERAYKRAITEATEGFAGEGMFYSGIKKRALGAGEVEYKAGEEKRELGYQAGVGRLGRREEALQLGETTERRDIGRAEEEAIAGGVLTRKGEAERQYWSPIVQGYTRLSDPYNLSGYGVPDYLQY